MRQSNMMRNVLETGHIQSLYSSVAQVTGLPNIGFHEVLVNKAKNPVALVMGYRDQSVDAVFFDDHFDVNEPVFRSHTSYEISCSTDYLGRVVDGFGNPIDGYGAIGGKKRSVFADGPDIFSRAPVNRPLTTGIKVIDTTLSIGRGQRELLIGNRKLGKSSIALSTIISQHDQAKPVYSVYVLVGQKARQVEHVVSILKKFNVWENSVVVAATGDQSYAMQYLAPFVGTAIAEHFRDESKDALIIYDDLSKHAKVYRDISLLLERIPGREAYPGDIFSLHAQLLERSGQLSKDLGGGSLTALPIIETQQSDITSYVPTNIISITDGQIYLDEALFHKQFLPAVNVGLSVSRIGSQAQPPLLKDVSKGLRLALAQHKQLQKLTQLETTISEKTKKQIHRGELILDLLKQENYQVISWEEQTVLFYAVENGFFDDLQSHQWQHFEQLLLEMLRTRYKFTLAKIRQGKITKIDDFVHKAITDFKKEFLE